MLSSGIRRSEPGVVSKLLATDRAQKRTQLPLLVEQRHDEPAPVARLVVVCQRIRGMVTMRTQRDVLSEQPRLHGARIGPQAALQQRRTHHAALPGLFSSIQCRY